jgi:hypothetical protein
LRQNLPSVACAEIQQFFNALNIGQIAIKKFRYIKSRKTFEISTITEWTSTDDDGKEEVVKQEVLWEFTLDSFDTEYPLESGYDWLYREFLLAKGFRKNRFKCV